MMDEERDDFEEYLHSIDIDFNDDWEMSEYLPARPEETGINCNLLHNIISVSD